MSVYSIPLVNGQYIRSVEQIGLLTKPYHQVGFSYDSAPSAGTISVEYRTVTDGDWRLIKGLNGVAISTLLQIPFFGIVDAYRFTIAGVSGGSNLRAEVLDTDVWMGPGFPEGVFDGNRAITQQNYIEANVKNGLEYEAASLTEGLLAGANIDTIFITGAKPVIIKSRIVKFNGTKLQTRVYRAPDYTGGTPATVFNLNDIGPVATSVQILGGATVSNAGTEFGAPTFDLGSSGIGNVSLSTYTVVGIERVLRPNTTYLQRITNTSGATQDVAGYLTWFEGFPDLPQ